MALSRLDTKTRVGDQAYEALHAAIVTGEYGAGRRLQIRDLAAELGISVMPVREAIKRLEEVGLVETEPYRGAVVKRFTHSELLQIYTVRRLLEVEAARLGAPNLTEGDIERLGTLYAEMEQTLRKGVIVDYLDLDESILQIVYEASGNDVLVEMIRSLWDRCRAYKILGARDEYGSGNSERLLEYQESLIAAARVGDGATVARITADSLDAAIARIRHAMPDDEGLAED